MRELGSFVGVNLVFWSILLVIFSVSDWAGIIVLSVFILVAAYVVTNGVIDGLSRRFPVQPPVHQQGEVHHHYNDRHLHVTYGDHPHAHLIQSNSYSREDINETIQELNQRT